MIEPEEQPEPEKSQEPPSTKTSFWVVVRRILWSLILLAVIAYGGAWFWLVNNEEKLIFHPSRIVSAPENIPRYRLSNVTLKTSDGVGLSGWQIQTSAGDSTGAWLLYLHGNAGNVSQWADRYYQFTRLGVNVLAVDYRGYGESEGHPDEQGLYRDAEAMYDYLADVVRVPPHRIILYGHSLGSAVAIELALRREAACLIVEGAFTSIPDRGQELYPYFPVWLFARNKFDSIHKIGFVTIPKLFIHAADDEVIPLKYGQRLFNAAAPPKIFLLVRGGHSESLFVDEEDVLGGIWSFLSNLHTIPLRKNPIQPDATQ
jgi:fermentation-respiration switch protein FrsA (DUF1100 family)